jgi:hypothetical protein
LEDRVKALLGQLEVEETLLEELQDLIRTANTQQGGKGQSLLPFF